MTINGIYDRWYGGYSKRDNILKAMMELRRQAINWINAELLSIGP